MGLLKSLFKSRTAPEEKLSDEVRGPAGRGKQKKNRPERCQRRRN